MHEELGERFLLALAIKCQHRRYNEPRREPEANTGILKYVRKKVQVNKCLDC